MHALLAIDLGTTGVKAALFAVEDGGAISSAFVDYPALKPILMLKSEREWR